MPTIAIIGGQWGDEGKGKVVDYLAQQAQVVARFSGGPNAGHTVINQWGEFRLHLVPSGMFNPGVSCLIGTGVVVDPKVLIQEIFEIQQAGVDLSRLFISPRAHLIMPYHILLDGLEEAARGVAALGTTLRGVGPAYADRAARLGLRCGDLLDKKHFAQRLEFVLAQKNALLTKLYGAPPLSLEEVYSQYMEYGQRLAPHIAETEVILAKALERGETVLLEGAQGTLLDLDFGTYPYVTSSSATVSGAGIGVGLNPRYAGAILGVFKAYITRVGEGPFPTEMEKAIGEQVRQQAQEYGATTGRPRHCGWFDGVAARYAVGVNGFTSLALTRLDILDNMANIRLAVAYRWGEQVLERFPYSLEVLKECQPIYRELPGWQASTRQVRHFADLPAQAQAYVRTIEEITSCPVSLISVGSHRDETIIKEPILS